MRTQGDILARIKSAEGEDFLGFRRDVLIDALDYEHAKQYLKPDVTAEQWAESQLTTDEKTLDALKSYLEFAWSKAEDHRGISAGRSIEKLTEYAWLLGRDDVVHDIEAAPYPQYGCPKLAVVARAFALPIPDSDNLDRMIRGLRCNADYDCGCGF